MNCLKGREELSSINPQWRADFFGILRRQKSPISKLRSGFLIISIVVCVLPLLGTVKFLTHFFVLVTGYPSRPFCPIGHFLRGENVGFPVELSVFQIKTTHLIGSLVVVLV